MSQIRKFFKRNRVAVGLQLALALVVPAKGKNPVEMRTSSPGTVFAGATSTTPGKKQHRVRAQASPDLKAYLDQYAIPRAQESLGKVRQSAEEMLQETMKITAIAARCAVNESGFAPEPMNYEQVRLWLQSFNAGPYATLRYKGNVPFQETRQYVPKVLRAYQTYDTETQYDFYIRKSAARYGLDPQMVKAIMKTESNFRNKTVSHAGARGLMQVMPSVWKDVQKKYNFGWKYSSGVFEPEKNIEVACAYLAWLRYDFLPRHFEAFDREPNAPTILVRDHDRGVPDRKSPRIVVSYEDREGELAQRIVTASLSAPAAALSRSADRIRETRKQVDGQAVAKASSDAKTAADSATQAEESADNVVSRSTSDGRTRVVLRSAPGKPASLRVTGREDEQGGAAPARESKTVGLDLPGNVRGAKHVSRSRNEFMSAADIQGN